MKPTIGGPHWMVMTGGLLCAGRPSNDSAAAAGPLGGLCQWNSVSQRSLEVTPSKITLSIVMSGVLTCWVIGPDEPDGPPMPEPTDGRLLTWACRAIDSFSGLKSKGTKPGGPSGSRHRIDAGTRPPATTEAMPRPTPTAAPARPPAPRLAPRLRLT